jgi:hypothetical protein
LKLKISPIRPTARLLFAALRDLPEAIWLDSGKPKSFAGLL